MRMKQYLIAIALLTVSAGMMAQSKTGTWALLPKVGVTIANITNNDLKIVDTDGILKSKSQAGYQVGLDVQYQCADNLALSLGAFYASLGNRYDDYELLVQAPGEDKQALYDNYTDFHTTLQYVQVPLMVHLYAAPGLAIKAGIQMGVLTHAATEYDVRGFKQDTETGVRIYNETSTAYKDTSKEGYKKMDISIPLGLSYEYMNVVVDARYNWGLTKIHNLMDSKNSFFTFTVGYKFEL